MADDIKATRKKLSDYQPDPHNANLGSERGYRFIDDSITEDGVGRSGLVDKNGVVIAGNQTLSVLAANGIEDVIEVETTGREWVVVKRTDTDLADDDPNNTARRMAFRDNRSQEVSLTWNPEQLQADKEAGVKVVEKLWSPVELEILGGNSEMDFSAEEHWVGLPEYERGENSSQLQMIVHFETDEDRQDFAKRLDLKITEKTNNTWWPVKERRDVAAIRFESE